MTANAEVFPVSIHPQIIKNDCWKATMTPVNFVLRL